MIARFSVRLPFVLSIPECVSFPAIETQIDGYDIRIHQPYFADAADAGSFKNENSDLVSGIQNYMKAQPYRYSEHVLINETKSAEANLLWIDFIRDNFDRRKTVAPNPRSDDPPQTLCFNVLNSFLVRLRSATRAPEIKPLEPQSTTYSIQYLSDDEKVLKEEPGLTNLRAGRSQRIRIIAITDSTWSLISTLGDAYAPQAWDSLLYDAEAILPEVGASIVLAYSA